MPADAAVHEPYIAVIAVHGVADQKPFASARDIANLLVDYPHDAQQRYSTFVESEIRLAVDPIYPRQKVFAAENFWGDTRASAENDITGYGHEFMSEILSGRQMADPPEVYATVRLEGRRFEPDPAKIHVYELFWADLSRVGSGVAQFFGELYQLLLHLPSLGKHSVSFAARENPSPLWKLYRGIERWGARLLALIVPVLNLILLALFCLLLPRLAGPNMQFTLAYLIPAVVAMVVCALLLRDRKLHAMVWLGAVPVVALMTVLAVSAVFHWLDADALSVLAAEVWLLTVAGMLVVLRAYGRRQRRALPFGAFLFAAATLYLAWWWNRLGPSDVKIAEVSLHMAAGTLLVLGVVWFVWMLLTLIAGLLAVIAPLTVPKSDGKRKRARRAAWTGQFALVLAGSLFAVVTTVLWALLFRGLRRLPTSEFALYEGPVKWLKVSRILAEVPDSLLTANIIYWYMIALLSLLVFVVAAAWAVFPSILAELKPPTTHPAERSRAGGTWLSRGITLIGFASASLTLGIAIIFVLELLAFFRGNEGSPVKSATSTELAASLLAAASALVLFMIGTKQWMAGALSALDVLLDIDNYMREHPRESAPRAQIAERYASLLRFLCRWKDDSGRGYDAIVIMAHSQGTVITADLLRFLRIEWNKPGEAWEPQLACILDDAASSRIPIYFFTMGSPLRQLYNLCFPHHYAWLDEDLPQYAALAKGAPIPAKTSPSPEEVGAKRWVNAYRSGDYVGRTIWVSHEYESVWCQGPPLEDGARSRRERCIGRGAHTHYWDNTAAEVAAELHKLLGEAAQGR